MGRVNPHAFFPVAASSATTPSGDSVTKIRFEATIGEASRYSPADRSWLTHATRKFLTFCFETLESRLWRWPAEFPGKVRTAEHTSGLQSPCHLVCRLLLV